jgi:hypothetical protein
MTQTQTQTKPSITIRATECELVAQLVRFGNDTPVVCETQPRPLWAVSVDHGETVEVIGLFPNAEAATEAAEALTQQMKAMLGTDLKGPKLATLNGRTLQ